MSKSQGVWGDLSKPLSPSDLRLVRRAMRQCWPVPLNFRKRAVEEVWKVLGDLNAGPRERLAAVRALASVSRLNLDAVRTTIKAHEYEVLGVKMDELEEAARLEDERRAAGRGVLPH